MQKANTFHFYKDFFSTNNNTNEVFYQCYDPNSRLIYHENEIFSISERYFNIWNVENMEEIMISEQIILDLPYKLLDIELNHKKELFLTLFKKSENLLVSGISLKTLKKKKGLKLSKMKRKSSISMKTFTFSEIFSKDTLNLSQFLLNDNKEREKFMQMDYIFEVIYIIYNYLCIYTTILHIIYLYIYVYMVYYIYILYIYMYISKDQSRSLSVPTDNA